MPGSGCPSNSNVLRVLTGKAASGSAERLLPHLDECELCRLAVGEAARELTRSDPAGHIRTLADGELVGRYRIDRLLGRGGMGEVYEGFDQVLTERVALKTVRLTSLDDPAAYARFKAEVQLARRVSHPNVCRVLEFGLLERSARPGGREVVPYFTMELLNGETLTNRIVRLGSLSRPCARSLAAQMSRGLQAIHEAGIVHRDFKSDNVLLVHDRDQRVRALVTDFGLARGDEGNDGSSTDGLVGTLDYIAPEQVAGAPATPVSDVFALGVVIFEMLTGRRPFRGVDRLSVDAPAPSRLVPGLPPAWDVLLGRCLARAPTARFQSMAEVIAALEGLDGPPALAGDARVSGRRPGRTRRLVAGASLAVAAAGGLLVWRPPPEPTPPVAIRTPGTSPARQDRVEERAASASVAIDVAPPSLPSVAAVGRRAPAGRVSRKRGSPGKAGDEAAPPAAPTAAADAEVGKRDAVIKPDFAPAPPAAADRVSSPFTR